MGDDKETGQEEKKEESDDEMEAHIDGTDNVDLPAPQVAGVSNPRIFRLGSNESRSH